MDICDGREIGGTFTVCGGSGAALIYQFSIIDGAAELFAVTTIARVDHVEADPQLIVIPCPDEVVGNLELPIHQERGLRRSGVIVPQRKSAQSIASI